MNHHATTSATNLMLSEYIYIVATCNITTTIHHATISATKVLAKWEKQLKCFEGEILATTN